ncbi:MAG TPA: isoaspartyl peptidase/L-asparaginase [Steroidobacteraceae bacterium]|jgi:beta-aspartyl-peptidase (threonine type)|nr:isoaspartyl peptidase/L-asparaginase [Steroidobacteraceae bacterium]
MFMRHFFAAVLIASAGVVTPSHAASPKAYDYYSAGKLKSPRPGKTEGALMLLGGGDWPVPAFRWFVEKMGHGHLVILRASGTDDLQKDFIDEIGGAASVETIVFHSREAAGDPRVLKILRHADGIFFGGGDQSNYVRYFKGTPLNALIEEHVRAGKPIGGTSAGLAILGAWSYGAMDGGSLVSEDAMKNPLGGGVTLVGDFLHLPYLSRVITDSHFAIRERWGRLLVFVGRLATEQKDAGITGIGIDEKAALCVEANGVARVYSIGRGFAWLVRPLRAPDALAAAPFNFRGVPVVGVGEESALDLKTFAVMKPAFSLNVNIVNGEFDAASLAALKSAAATPLRVAAKGWALAIHGGAGVIERGDLTSEKEAEYRASLNAALAAGEKVLRGGGSSLDAVEASIRVLEDDPLFNAGRGAVFTADGRNELDASIMNGATRMAGAVAGATRTRNPITLARAVMEKSPHVMLAREGADQFSVEQGLPQVDPGYFRTEQRWQQLLDWRRDNAKLLDPTHSRGTVGAVAIDVNGHVAAGTSTGGMTGKRWGRIGDSPVIGAGTYAVDGNCAVSATGSGEYFIRASAARQLCDRIAWRGADVQAAASATISDIGDIGGDGGVIAMDGAGTIGFAMNSSGMYRGWVTSNLAAATAIYSSEAGPNQGAK